MQGHLRVWLDWDTSMTSEALFVALASPVLLSGSAGQRGRIVLKSLHCLRLLMQALHLCWGSGLFWCLGYDWDEHRCGPHLLFLFRDPPALPVAMGSKVLTTSSYFICGPLFG